MDESADYYTVPNITFEVVPTPVPIFVGTYSHVLKGYHRGSPVAIKVLRIVCPTLHAMRRKMSREREVWGHLKHPNIVPLIGYTDDSEQFGPFGALVSEWCEYGNASQYLQTYDVDVSQREKLWCDVIKGVIYLHNYDPTIVHGDLKPGNILIDWDHTAKICDFGLVQVLLEDGHSGMTTTSEHTGTLRYLAPELVVADDNAKPTIASDVYAMGCIGLEFLFNQLPFANRTNNRTGQLHQDIREGISPGCRPDDSKLSRQQIAWWEVLKLCWAWDPSMRKSAWLILELLTLFHHEMRVIRSQPIDIPGSAWAIELIRRRLEPSPMHLEGDFTPYSYIEPSPMSTSTHNQESSNPLSVIMASRSNSQRDPMIISPNLSGTRISMPMSISPGSVSNLPRTRPQSTKSSVANPSHLKYSTLPE